MSRTVSSFHALMATSAWNTSRCAEDCKISRTSVEISAFRREGKSIRKVPGWTQSHKVNELQQVVVLMTFEKRKKTKHNSQREIKPLTSWDPATSSSRWIELSLSTSGSSTNSAKNVANEPKFMRVNKSCLHCLPQAAMGSSDAALSEWSCSSFPSSSHSPGHLLQSGRVGIPRNQWCLYNTTKQVS